MAILLWKKTKPDRIEKGEYAIVTTKRGDNSEGFTLFKSGHIIGFFSSKKGATDFVKVITKKNKKREV